jgi:hypothetical protein
MYLRFRVLPASCRHNETIRDRTICRQDAQHLRRHLQAPLNRHGSITRHRAGGTAACFQCRLFALRLMQEVKCWTPRPRGQFGSGQQNRIPLQPQCRCNVVLITASRTSASASPFCWQQPLPISAQTRSKTGCFQRIIKWLQQHVGVYHSRFSFSSSRSATSNITLSGSGTGLAKQR